MGDFYKDSYGDYWVNAVKRYGIGSYEKAVLNMLDKCSSQYAFEIGIGTGWPFAAYLAKKGTAISGCDISKRVIRELKKSYPDFQVYVGEFKKQDKKFDLVYCIRSSWFMENFYQVLYEMMDSVEDGGHLIFDIMDQNAPYYLYNHYYESKPNTLKECYRKYIIKENLEKNPPLNFYSISKINRILKNCGFSFKIYHEKSITHVDDFWTTPKRLYYCRKCDGNVYC